MKKKENEKKNLINIIGFSYSKTMFQIIELSCIRHLNRTQMLGRDVYERCKCHCRPDKSKQQKKEIFLVKSIICKVMIIVTKRGGDNYSNMIIRSM